MLEKIKHIFDDFIKKQEHQKKINAKIEQAQIRWDGIDYDYFLRLSKMLNISINEFEKEYRAYFTFGQRCPFSKSEFMFNQYGDISNTAAHEIMHIEFLKKYHRHCLERGLSESQIQHFKEILTVLLNVEMKDLMYRPDRGYEKHHEVRDKILGLYLKHKEAQHPFIDFLNKAIDLYKESDIKVRT